MESDQLKEMFTMALSMLAQGIPLLLVYIGGIVAAIVLWRRCPRPSLLVTISCAVSIAVRCAWPFAYSSLWYLRESRGWSMRSFSYINSAVGLIETILDAGAFGLLLIAAFVRRGETPDVAGQAVPRVRRVSAALYAGSMAGGQIVGLLFLCSGIAIAAINNDSYSSSESAIAIAVVLDLIGALLVLCGSVFYLVALYKAWASIQDGHARTTPGKAVGFLFIPFYNFYWVFQAIPGFADDYNAYLDRAKISAPPMGRGLLQALAVLQVLSVIPFVGLLLSLVAMPMSWATVVKFCAAINALPEAAPQAV